MVAARTPFRGRVRERHELDRLLDGARAGDSGVLVIRGEPGIGKTALTALTHHCLRQAVVPESDWAVGIEARSRALPTSGEDAEIGYLQSIDALSRTPLRLDLGRPTSGTASGQALSR